MPNYGTPQSGGLTALAPGESMYLFNAETPAAPQASIPFARAFFRVFRNTRCAERVGIHPGVKTVMNWK